MPRLKQRCISSTVGNVDTSVDSTHCPQIASYVACDGCMWDPTHEDSVVDARNPRGGESFDKSRNNLQNDVVSMDPYFIQLFSNGDVARRRDFNTSNYSPLLSRESSTSIERTSEAVLVPELKLVTAKVVEHVNSNPQNRLWFCLLVTIPIFFGYGTLIKLQSQLRTHLWVSNTDGKPLHHVKCTLSHHRIANDVMDDGPHYLPPDSRAAYLFGLAVSFYYIGLFIFRIGHNIIFGFRTEEQVKRAMLEQSQYLSSLNKISSEIKPKKEEAEASHTLEESFNQHHSLYNTYVPRKGRYQSKFLVSSNDKDDRPSEINNSSQLGMDLEGITNFPVRNGDTREYDVNVSVPEVSYVYNTKDKIGVPEVRSHNSNLLLNTLSNEGHSCVGKPVEFFLWFTEVMSRIALYPNQRVIFAFLLMALSNALIAIFLYVLFPHVITSYVPGSDGKETQEYITGSAKQVERNLGIISFLVLFSYFLGGVAVSTFEPNIMACITPLGKKNKSLAAVGVPFGTNSVTIIVLIALGIGAPSHDPCVPGSLKVSTTLRHAVTIESTVIEQVIPHTTIPRTISSSFSDTHIIDLPSHSRTSVDYANRRYSSSVELISYSAAAVLCILGAVLFHIFFPVPPPSYTSRYEDAYTFWYKLTKLKVLVEQEESDEIEFSSPTLRHNLCVSYSEMATNSDKESTVCQGAVGEPTRYERHAVFKTQPLLIEMGSRSSSCLNVSNPVNYFEDSYKVISDQLLTPTENKETHHWLWRIKYPVVVSFFDQICLAISVSMAQYIYGSAHGVPLLYCPFIPAIAERYRTLYRIDHNYFLIIYFVFAFLGAVMSRHFTFFTKKRINPVVYLLTSLVPGIVLVLTKTPILALIGIFLIMYGNGAVYASSIRIFDETVPLECNLVALSVWMAVGDVGGFVGANLVVPLHKLIGSV